MSTGSLVEGVCWSARIALAEVRKSRGLAPFAACAHGLEAAEKIVPGLGAELGSPVAFSHGVSVSARMPLTMRWRP
jgi:hypothetical protein